MLIVKLCSVGVVPPSQGSREGGKVFFGSGRRRGARELYLWPRLMQTKLGRFWVKWGRQFGFNLKKWRFSQGSNL